jgi:hypothetical protein
MGVDRANHPESILIALRRSLSAFETTRPQSFAKPTPIPPHTSSRQRRISRPSAVGHQPVRKPYVKRQTERPDPGMRSFRMLRWPDGLMADCAEAPSKYATGRRSTPFHEVFYLDLERFRLNCAMPKDTSKADDGAAKPYDRPVPSPSTSLSSSAGAGPVGVSSSIVPTTAGPLLCYCGQAAAKNQASDVAVRAPSPLKDSRQVKKSNANNGRWFWKCSKWGKTVGVPLRPVLGR